jgi:hypothetical protein
MEYTKDKLEELIAENRIKELIKFLLEKTKYYLSDNVDDYVSKIKREIILISSQWHEMQGAKRVDIVEPADANIKMAKIAKALIEIIDHLPDEVLKYEKVTKDVTGDERKKTSKVNIEDNGIKEPKNKDLDKRELLEEIRLLVRKYQGEIDSNNWITIRDGIYAKFSKMDEGELARMFDQEKELFKEIKAKIQTEAWKFVFERRAKWGIKEWIDFKKGIFERFGPFEENLLADILEDEKKNYFVKEIVKKLDNWL